MMIFAIVGLCLFGWGALGLFGYWRIITLIGEQGAATAKRLEGFDRTDQSIVELAEQVYCLRQSIEAQQVNVQGLRAKLDTFIDGPPSLRSPPAGGREVRRAQLDAGNGE